MNVFILVPTRAYGLDVIIPLLFEFKKLYPNLKAKFIFVRKKEYIELCENKVLFDHVNCLGSIVKCFGNRNSEKRSKWLNKGFKFLSILPVLITMLLARRSVLFVPRRIEAFSIRMMTKINNISGKTFCYLMASTSFRENLAQYFDKDGNRRPGIRETSKKINVADGLLAYHNDNLIFLELQGYKKNVIIGYPMMYPAFQERIKDISQRYLKNEIGDNVGVFNVISIFLNKYYGKTSGCDDTWAQERLAETVRIVRFNYPNSFILVRAHPMVESSKVILMIKNLNTKNVKQTYLHTFVLGCCSEFVVSIAQSSTAIQVLAFDTPVVDYGRIADEFYGLFPEGSLYADFGVQVAFTPEELGNVIGKIGESRKWLEIFHKRLNHRMDLDVFTKYWD